MLGTNRPGYKDVVQDYTLKSLQSKDFSSHPPSARGFVKVAGNQCKLKTTSNSIAERNWNPSTCMVLVILPFWGFPRNCRTSLTHEIVVWFWSAELIPNISYICRGQHMNLNLWVKGHWKEFKVFKDDFRYKAMNRATVSL